MRACLIPLMFDWLIIPATFCAATPRFGYVPSPSVDVVPTDELRGLFRLHQSSPFSARIQRSMLSILFWVIGAPRCRKTASAQLAGFHEAMDQDRARLGCSAGAGSSACRDEARLLSTIVVTPASGGGVMLATMAVVTE